jgi:hypothetical protein
MTDLDPVKVHVRYLDGCDRSDFSLPRRYTLTHSDRTGDRFLTIGRDYDLEQISGGYTRFMRDEVLAEWLNDPEPRLNVYFHVSGGLVFGHAGLRCRIFRSCQRSVLQAFRYGDGSLFQKKPELDERPALVQYRSNKARYNFIEESGPLKDYRPI